MNTVLVLQPEDVARLLEIDKGIQALLRERESILTKAVRTEYEEPETPDFSMFKDTTRRLLTELWDAPRRMLSHQDIREDVMFDEYANDGAVRKAMCIARRELKRKNFSYDIKNIKDKGYKLVARETLPTLPAPPKIREKRQKNVRKKGNVR